MPEEIDYGFDEGGGCWRCGGAGWEITCIDDLCHGAGECMHGDGEEPCPVCNKDGSKDRW